MDIKYIEKKMEKIIPKGVSLLEFMTFGVIVMSTYIFFSNFSLLRLNRKMIREIIYIFSFKNIFVLTIFVLIFVVVIDKIQYKIKIKYDFKYNFVQWKLLTKKFIELYFFVLSLYLSSFVLLNQKLNEYNTYEMICFLFFIVSVWIYCINVLSKIFKEDSYFDYEYNKSKYLNNTLLKFEGKKY